METNVAKRSCMQTTSFRSTKRGRTYSICENSKMARLLYLCTCKKCLIQFVGKTEWPFNQRLNKHRFDVPDVPQIDHRFNQAGYDFDRDAHFTLIEKIKNREGDTKPNENLCIKELQTQHTDGLNEYLNRL